VLSQVSSGWAALDQYYRVVPGELTVVTGVPSSGKSEWLDALLVNLSAAYGWSFALCSFEKPVGGGLPGWLPGPPQRRPAPAGLPAASLGPQLRAGRAWARRSLYRAPGRRSAARCCPPASSGFPPPALALLRCAQVTHHARQLLEKYYRRPFWPGDDQGLSRHEVQAGLEWLSERFHLIKFDDERMPSIDDILDNARVAVLRWGRGRGRGGGWGQGMGAWLAAGAAKPLPGGAQLRLMSLLSVCSGAVGSRRGWHAACGTLPGALVAAAHCGLAAHCGGACPGVAPRCWRLA
jgi:hypothetical protein